MNKVTSDNTDVQSPDLPLGGVRVVEILSGTMRHFGRLLADLGAEVTHFQLDRQGLPVAGDRFVSDINIDSFVLNKGKQVVSMEMAAINRELMNQVETVDILVEDISAVQASVDTLDINRLREKNPGLVVVSVSNFGREGGYSQWHASDPVFHALSGELSRSGIPGREPLLPPGSLAAYCACGQAAFVAVLAFYERLQSGRGDWLDFSVLDGSVQTLDPGFGVAGSAAAGVRASHLPRGRPEARFQYPILKCADGYVRICVLAPRQWQGMFEWMGSPTEFADPSYNNIMTRFQSPTLLPAIGKFFADKASEELVQQGQRFGVPIAVLLSPGEAADTEQNQVTRAFSRESPVEGVEVEISRGAVSIDGARPEPGCQASPGTALREQLFGGAAEAALSSQDKTGCRPLAGIRVLDLGVIVVGAETGRLLGDAGADVIKVENSAFPDGIRQTRDGSLMSPSFAAGQRNKRSLGLNLRSESGRAIFLEMVKQSDVLLTNFKPGTLESLGFGEDTLLNANPRLVMIDSSAFGPVGPASRSLGYGPLVRASSGVTSLWTYSGEPDSFSDAMTVYPDHYAARLGALTALALMIRSRRTGKGGAGSIAQAEIILDHLNLENVISDIERAGHAVAGSGNDVPWGVFPCAGDDEWCAVTVSSDREWQQLAGLIGLSGDEELAHRAGRIAQREKVDNALKSWLSSRTPVEAMTSLQAAGIAAGAMLRVSDMPEFGYYKEREFFKQAEHPVLSEPFIVEARPVRSENLADPDNAPAPLMGEQSKGVLADWLNMRDSDVDKLVADGIVTLFSP